jgi:hypothetical protein
MDWTYGRSRGECLVVVQWCNCAMLLLQWNLPKAKICVWRTSIDILVFPRRSLPLSTGALQGGCVLRMFQGLLSKQGRARACEQASTIGALGCEDENCSSKESRQGQALVGAIKRDWRKQ